MFVTKKKTIECLAQIQSDKIVKRYLGLRVNLFIYPSYFLLHFRVKISTNVSVLFLFLFFLSLQISIEHSRFTLPSGLLRSYHHYFRTHLYLLYKAHLFIFQICQVTFVFPATGDLLPLTNLNHSKATVVPIDGDENCRCAGAEMKRFSKQRNTKA